MVLRPQGLRATELTADQLAPPLHHGLWNATQQQKLPFDKRRRREWLARRDKIVSTRRAATLAATGDVAHPADVMRQTKDWWTVVTSRLRATLRGRDLRAAETVQRVTAVLKSTDHHAYPSKREPLPDSRILENLRELIHWHVMLERHAADDSRAAYKFDSAKNEGDVADSYLLMYAAADYTVVTHDAKIHR